AIGDTIPAQGDSIAGRVACEGRTIHVEDMFATPETQFTETKARMRRLGQPSQTILATPLLREGTTLGVIIIRRTEVRPFSGKQIELLETFANQAVIAIENVRLFTELREKNRALTEAHAQVTETLEQQTATAEILQVIASSPTDIQPVFEAVARNASRLCGT